MKPYILAAMFVFEIQLLVPSAALAQGTVYVSNLGQPAAGNVTVASNYWRAEYFIAGTNSGGYLLNGVQLQLANATGNPAGFSVFIYSNATAFYPDGLLGSLNGATNPTSSGVYTFNSDTSILLRPNGIYQIVLAATTPLASGAYGWSYGVSVIPIELDRWTLGTKGYVSNDGLSWSSTGGYLEFAVNATAIPEPSALALLGLGTLLLAARRRRL